MTADQFRRVALALPESTEVSHMQHPDFRVRGRVFATLGYPNDNFAVVKLTPGQQDIYVQSQPAVFAPVAGAWGSRGYTNILLRAARVADVRDAVETAWRNCAPASVVSRAPRRPARRRPPAS